MPTLECNNPGAYEIAGSSLYNITIGPGVTGALSSVLNTLFTLGSDPINAIGYHTVQNYIYGISYLQSPQAIVRIGAGGVVQDTGFGIDATAATDSLLIGDIDGNQQYWLAYNGGENYVQVDMDAASLTYGQVVKSGTATNFTYDVGDWAYVDLPGFGTRLWALGQQAVNPISGLLTPIVGGAIANITGNITLEYNTVLLYFDTATLEWNEVFTFTKVAGGIIGLGQANWGAVYSAKDGNIYATDSVAGQTWRFTLTPSTGALAYPITLLGTLGVVAGQIDGANCALNTEFPSLGPLI